MQYLVKWDCHFSWQAHHFVNFWEIAGAPNVVFFHTKCVSKIVQVEPGKPGAEVSKNKNYKSKKVFAYRMCTA